MNNKDEIFRIYDPSLFNINDFDVLLHEILKQTRQIINCEAGSIYINENEALNFNVFQNDAMSYENVYKHFYTLKDLSLPLSEEKKYLAVKSFVNNKVIIVDDVYASNDFDFLGVKEFDKKFKYKTKSIITFPLIHPLENKKVGVLQLINKISYDSNDIISFDEKDNQILSIISSFIALSILKAQLDVEKLKKLNNELEKTNKSLKEKVEKEVIESKKKSAIIYHQSKLASLGEMIGNIAHQWRQPLSTISTIASGLNFNLEYLQKVDEKELSSGLNQIVKTTRHLSDTIDDFRNFFKADKEKNNFNLSSTILKSITIIEAALSTEYIQIITNLDDKIVFNGYENEFKQAILNILQNAKDALLKNIPREEERLILIDLFKENRKIIIQIKDNALGIDPSIIEKVFLQNFTTKEKDGGTGIGLYMTKEIIEVHSKGSINVKNVSFTYNKNIYTGALITIIL